MDNPTLALRRAVHAGMPAAMTIRLMPEPLARARRLANHFERHDLRHRRPDQRQRARRRRFAQRKATNQSCERAHEAWEQRRRRSRRPGRRWPNRAPAARIGSPLRRAKHLQIALTSAKEDDRKATPMEFPSKKGFHLRFDVPSSDASANVINDVHTYEVLVQGVVDYAIYMLSPEGLVTTWNSGAERIQRLFGGGNHWRSFFALLHR